MTSVFLAAVSALGMALIVTGGERPASFPRRLFQWTRRIHRPDRCSTLQASAWAVGAAVPGLLVLRSGTMAGVGALAGVLLYRERKTKREITVRESKREAWPGVIEAVRMAVTSLGHPLPRALFDAGRAAGAPMSADFQAAEQHWLLTTDFRQAINVLKNRLEDPVADTVCETLVLAHQVGGSTLGRRLQVLADDRWLDLQARRDARAKQAGVRFARRFVVVVPLGMGAAGLTIGDGAAAFTSAGGQLAIAAAGGLVIGCWKWAGYYLQMPEEQRVFL